MHTPLDRLDANALEPDAGSHADGTDPAMDAAGQGLFQRLAEKAERVRWRMEEVPWDRLDKEKADVELLHLVREIAFSELTTFTASQRFLKDFWDDPDFTQWVSVWFYEETRHPNILLKWLRHFDVAVDEKFLLRGRGTSAFMKSRMGTLVTNIISEMVAASNYRNLSLLSPEPVLAWLARHIGNDEARHASSFYAFAKRMLARSEDPAADRRDALKVLYMWFRDNDRVQHPVNEFYGRYGGRNGPGTLLAKVKHGYGDVRRRACRKIGGLVGADIAEPEDILRCLKG